MIRLRCRDLTRLLILGCLFIACCAAEEEPTYYKTEPWLERYHIGINTEHDRSLVEPGLIFLTRAGNGPDYEKFKGYGPELWDLNGTLVWSGARYTDNLAMRLNLCDYDGSHGKHLCFHDSAHTTHIGQPYHAGAIKVLDNSYKMVAKLGKIGKLDLPDGHEVNTPDSCSHCMMRIIYQPREIKTGDGKSRHIIDCCFQEINTKSETSDFEWCLFDQLDGSVSDLAISNYDSNKHRPGPADIWHMNGADRNTDGDYLISIRELATVMKIAGKNSAHGAPGDVIWRLGGTNSSFEQDFDFGGQHSARFVNSTESTEVITFFNNAFRWDRKEKTSPESAGYLIEIDPGRNSAHLLNEFKSPSGQISQVKGSMQIMPNGNTFIGWGSRSRFTEFTSDGKIVFDGEYVDKSSHQAWKHPWKGRPHAKPKLVPYALECANAPLYAHVSWNGATEVTHWRFYASNVSAHGPWQHMRTASKDGFETQARLAETFASHVYAAALGTSGKVLGTSPVVEPFVPKADVKEHCDKSGCHKPARFTYSAAHSQGRTCSSAITRGQAMVDRPDFVVAATILGVTMIEAMVWLQNTLLWQVISLGAGGTHAASKGYYNPA